MSRETKVVRTDEILLKKIDYVSPYLKYIGRADFGSTSAQAKWQIIRITNVGDVESVEYVSKGAFSAIWDNRSSLFSAFSDPGNTKVKANIAASQTDSALVAAVASRKIRVVAYQVVVGGTATDVTFTTKPAGAGTAISMLHSFDAHGGISAPVREPWGYFETAAGEGLSVTTSAGSTVGIQIEYRLMG